MVSYDDRDGGEIPHSASHTRAPRKSSHMSVRVLPLHTLRCWIKYTIDSCNYYNTTRAAGAYQLGHYITMFAHSRIVEKFKVEFYLRSPKSSCGTQSFELDLLQQLFRCCFYFRDEIFTFLGYDVGSQRDCWLLRVSRFSFCYFRCEHLQLAWFDGLAGRMGLAQYGSDLELYWLVWWNRFLLLRPLWLYFVSVFELNDVIKLAKTSIL